MHHHEKHLSFNDLESTWCLDYSANKRRNHDQKDQVESGTVSRDCDVPKCRHRFRTLNLPKLVAKKDPEA